ncbi:VOC family protein [Actinophytocola gossypii]|uniref:VOC family protein n=1 Tax=Actinophytocola gossypii TaxID=2812003 RepID=A0ABT2J1B6_9PSEU|nr:VOC family protein [Actinophytocola gossypii]MCT2581646.1 VOC family protein [Actinophytocola gossypii]
MVSRVLAVTVDCRDTAGMVAFWCAALGYTETARWRDARDVEYVEIGRDGEPPLLFQPVDDPKTGKNRLHLDLAPTTGTQAEEVERLTGLGARVVSDEPEFPWVVLTDPQGNEFCVLPPR